MAPIIGVHSMNSAARVLSVEDHSARGIAGMERFGDRISL